MAKGNSEFQLDATEQSMTFKGYESFMNGYGDDEEDEDEEEYLGENEGIAQKRSWTPDQYEPLKIPKEQLDKMRAEYDVVIVHDFQDDYHLTEEELKEKNQFYEVFKTLRAMSRNHADVAGYIRHFREALKCLYAVADANGVYPRDKFIKMVLKGKIQVSGLRFPTLHKKVRKSINWDAVSEYVLDKDKNPDEFIVESDPYYDGIDEELVNAIISSFFGGDPIAFMEAQAKEAIPYGTAIDIDSIDPAGRNIVLPISKEDKKHMKSNKPITEAIAGFAAAQNKRRGLTQFAFDLTEDDFERIRRMDKNRGDEYLGIPVFKGSIFTSDVDRYLLDLEEYELDHTKVESPENEDKLITLRESNELTLKRQLEANGWNLRAFYNYEKEAKKAKKETKKLEKKKKRLKKRMIEMQARIDERSGKGSGINSKKKKHKGKKHKEMDRAFDNEFGGSFTEYQSMMESFNE